jgi:hypothetical protein
MRFHIEEAKEATRMHSRKSENKRNSDKIATYVILALATLGVVFVAISTRWGVGISPDSVAYIGGARNLVAGLGYTMPGNDIIGNHPITHYPPFYSLLLAGGGHIGIDPIVVARLINALFLGGTIALVGFLLRQLCHDINPIGYWISITGSFLVLTSFAIIEIHSMAWTEPAFMFLSLLGFIFLAKYIRNYNWLWLAISALLMGCALLTRYAGVSLVFSCAVGMFLYTRFSFFKKTMATSAFMALSTVFAFLWVLRNQDQAGTTTNRDIYFRAFNISHVWEGLDTFSSWLLIPGSSPAVIKLVPLLLLGGIVFAFLAYSVIGNRLKQKAVQITINPHNLPIILRLFLLFVPAYAAVIVITNSLLDTYTPLDGRILSPIYIPLLVLCLYTFGHLLAGISNKKAKVAFASITILFSLLHMVQGARLVHKNYNLGIGFNSYEWHRSEIMPQLGQLPSQIAIYSNAPEAIYIHTGRTAVKVPRENRTVDDLVNEGFDSEWNLMKSRIEDGTGVIVYFYLPWRNLPQTEDELVKILALDILASESDGAIYIFGHKR